MTFHFCVWTLPIDSRDKKHLFRSLVNFNLPFWLSLPLSFLENCTLNLSPDLHVSLGTCHCTPDSSVGSVGRASFSFPSTQVLACIVTSYFSCCGQASRVLLCVEDDNSSQSNCRQRLCSLTFQCQLVSLSIFIWPQCLHEGPVFGNGGRVWSIWNPLPS